jgi:hypothetical protein
VLAQKIPIEGGKVTRIENGRIYVSRGQISDVYSMEHYRIPIEVEAGGEREHGRGRGNDA